MKKNIEELKETISLAMISNQNVLAQKQGKIDIAKQEISRRIEYNELVSRNINDTMFEIKKTEIMRMD